MAKPTNTAPIRVKPSVLVRTKKLVAAVRRDGWKHTLDVNRNDPPTLGLVVEVAIERLEFDLMAERAKNR